MYELQLQTNTHTDFRTHTLALTHKYLSHIPNSVALISTSAVECENSNYILTHTYNITLARSLIILLSFNY